MRITSPDGVSLEEALARENGWTLDFAERVTDEYCGFLYLAATAGFEMTPSEFVDRAWHLHLTWPHYRDVLCGHILGRPLEHRPGTGAPGEEERYLGQYLQTLALYEKIFARAPPADIWPRPDPEADALERARARGRRLSLQAALVSLVAALPALAFGVKILAVVLFGAAFLFFLLSLPWESIHARLRKDGDGGSASCGGDGGCASCGGGCGGD